MSEKVDLSIRLLKPDAAHEIVAIHRHAFPAEVLRYSIYASKKIDAFVAAQLQKSDNWFLGAYLSDRLFGYAHIRALNDRAHLNYIVVSEAYRKQGLGGKLLERLQSDAKNQGFQSITLDAPAGNRTIRSWYESKGFRQASPPSISIIIDAASVQVANLSAAISISRKQWSHFLEFELSEIDITTESGTLSIGVIGSTLFRHAGNPQKELVAAACDFDRDREFLVTGALVDSIEYDYRLIGQSIFMELPL